MSKLIFKIGEESVPTVLNPNDIGSSPFADQLYTCQGILSDLLLKWSSTETQGVQKGIPAGAESPVVNNIIAFLGERGSGKTSCLYSIKKIFSNPQKHSATNIYSSATEFLPIIDPSFFDEHHNILELFIGQLYHTYNEELLSKWEYYSNSERQDLRNLNGWFSKVRQSILFLSNKKLELPEEQEGLSALSEGVNLSSYLSKLVQAFLKCKKKEFLVISIDDIDLNISETYKMMEEIRKYLVIPNVVILMAAKLKQLKNNIVLNLTKYYQPIIGSVMDKQGIQQMADRYLDKFIPLERRIFMPTLNDYSSAELDIIDNKETEVSNENHFESVEFALLSLIYKKCGYLFYNYEETPSLIVPENLRELRSLVTTLYEMKDRHIGKEEHIKNKNAFKNYFHTQWIQHLPGDQQNIVNNILKEKDLTKINKTVVSLLHEYADSLRSQSGNYNIDNAESGNLNQIRLKEIVNPANYSENVSLGDVMIVLNDLKNLAGSSRINHLIFFVNTFYSMLLYELYDKMTEEADKESDKNKRLDDPKEISKKNKSPRFPKLKNTKEYSIPDYFKIVGNGFFTLTGDTFINPPKDRRYSRELSMLNGILLYKLIEEVISEYDADKNTAVNSREFVLRLNIAEFFMLCSSRKITSNDGSYTPFRINNWRAESSQFYFSPFEADSKGILFDITSTFVNLISPSLAFGRYHRRFFDIAINIPGSLTYRLYASRRSHSLDSKHDLMSRSAIRNSEVLNDLNLWLVNNKDSSTVNTKNDLNMLKKFFENFTSTGKDQNGYSVRTYELNQGGEDYHTIDFSPFLILSEFLKSLIPAGKTDTTGDEDSDEEQKFQEFKKSQYVLFNRIYRKENMLSSNTAYTLQELIAILRDSRETNIPLKDDVITKVMAKTDGQIKSNLLVQYLAAIDVVDLKVLFFSYFDDELYSQYQNFVRDNMRQHMESLETNIKELEYKISSYNADYEGIVMEIKRMSPRGASVRRRIDKTSSELRRADRGISDCNKEINTIKENIQNLQLQLELNSKELDELKMAAFDQSKLQNDIETKIEKRGLTFLIENEKDIPDAMLAADVQDLKEELDVVKGRQDELALQISEKTKLHHDIDRRIISLNYSLSAKEKELKELSNRIINLTADIKKDQELEQTLSREENTMIQHRYDIKASIDNMKRSLATFKKELDIFQSKRESILSALNNRYR